MKIISEEIKIKKIENPDSKYIEKTLETRGIEPLRWAIVKAEKDDFVVSVSYCTD